jgi:hypothetical protein
MVCPLDSGGNLTMSTPSSSPSTGVWQRLVCFSHLGRMTELAEEGQESKPCGQAQLWLRCGTLIRWM